MQLCFLCKKTRFGIFSRGSKCEMCKQAVCGKCQSKVISQRNSNCNFHKH